MTDYSEADEVALGDKAVETAQFDRYKGRKGITDRLAIVSAGLIRGWNYYHEPSKTGFRAPKSAELLQLCKDNMGEPTQRFVIVVFHYTTDEAGNLMDDKKCSGRIKIWNITESRYEELVALHRNYPIMNNGFGQAQHDILINCTEEQYQRMSISPTPTAHWKTKEPWFDALVAKELKAKPKAKSSLGKELPDGEIMTLFGSSVNVTSSADNAAEVDLSDVLDD